jgi:hypothetical protein
MIMYHWVRRLCDRVDSRNNLIIFVRTMLDCEFVRDVILSWALMGVQLIEPFTQLVSTSNHLQLQVAFKSLFSDLQNHSDVARNITTVYEGAIPSLKPHFDKVISCNTYPKRWLDVLQVEVDGLDDGSIETITNLVGLYSHHCAITLQQQRGEAYGFASTYGPHPGT